MGLAHRANGCRVINRTFTCCTNHGRRSFSEVPPLNRSHLYGKAKGFGILFTTARPDTTCPRRSPRFLGQDCRCSTHEVCAARASALAKARRAPPCAALSIPQKSNRGTLPSTVATSSGWFKSLTPQARGRAVGDVVLPGLHRHSPGRVFRYWTQAGPKLPPWSPLKETLPRMSRPACGVA